MLSLLIRLALIALLAYAGVTYWYGRTEKRLQDMVPEEMGFGPIEANVFEPGYDTSGLEVLPESLDQALDSLETDRSFLEEGGVFEPDLIEAYIDAKREETALLRGNPHPLEHFLYFNI